jgi:hypothetical protein
MRGGGGPCAPTTARRHPVAATHWWSFGEKLYPRLTGEEEDEEEDGLFYANAVS